MKLILEIKNEETGEVLVAHKMELTNKGKLKFMPAGRAIKDAIKNKSK